MITEGRLEEIVADPRNCMIMKAEARELAAAYRRDGDYIDIVFDGPPSHESGRFIEVENSAGASISVGQWLQRADGYWVLRIPQSDSARGVKSDG